MYEDLYVQIDSRELANTGSIVVISEPLNVDMIVGNTGKEPTSGFEIIRPRPFCDMLKESKVPFCRVLSVFVGDKNSENCVDLSLAELMERTGLSKNTVRNAIDSMENSEFVVQGLRKVMINPRILHKGDSKRESYLRKSYDEMAKKYKKGKYAEKKAE